MINRRIFLAAASAAGSAVIGPFARATTAAIPGQAEIVRTSGYAAAGRGAALYVADAAVDRAYVAANAKTAFLSSDGRGFRLSLDQIITPYMLGAAGTNALTDSTASFSDLPDDTIALQAFFNFCGANIVSADWTGAFGVTASLTIGGSFGEVEANHRDTGSFNGSLYLGVKSNIPGPVIINQARRQCSFGLIMITGPGTGYPNYSARLFDIGIEFRDRALGQTWAGVYVGYARVAGVLIRNRIGYNDNVFHNVLHSCFFYGCGGGSNAGGVSSVSTGFNTHSRTGVTGGGDAVFQRSVLTVDTLPPEVVDSSLVPLFIRAGERLHHVMTMDRGTKMLTVRPQLSNAYGRTGGAGSLSYVFGGGLCTSGGDGGITTAKVSAQNCSIGYAAGTAYNGDVVLTAQDNFIGMCIGRFLDHVSVEGTTALYAEGNTFDIMWLADNRKSQSAHTITRYQNPALHKITGITYRQADDSLAPFRARALMINMGDRWLTFENEVSVNGFFEGHTCEFDRPYGNAIPLHNDNPTIKIAPEGSYMSLFGYRAQRYDITGHGTKNRPQGTVTVLNPGGGKTINRGAANANLTQSLAASTGPVSLQVAIGDDGNYLVSFLSGM